MKRIISLILILSILIYLPPTTGSQFGDDEVIYHYFQSLIYNGHQRLQNLIYNKKEKKIYIKVLSVVKDLEDYNVDHKILEILPPFKTFRYTINDIVVNYNTMIDYKDIEDPKKFLVFKVSLKNIERDLIILERCLDEIENITLRDKKGNVLKFNTKDIRRDIVKIRENINKYSEKLRVIEAKKRGFYIYANRDPAYLHSRVIIYGFVNYDSHLDSIILIQNDRRYVVEVVNNSFEIEIFTNTLGNHTIYGISPYGSSNKLIIRCLKIPTYMRIRPKGNLMAYLEEEIRLDVYLYDCYGNPLENKTIHVRHPHGEITYKTPSHIRIRLDDRYCAYTNSSIPIEIVFKGDDMYNSSKEIIYLRVLKIPTFITVRYDNDCIVGTLFDSRGNPLDNKRVYLIVDNNSYSTVTENGSFKFPISKFKKGYVVFKGDEKYAPSSKEFSYRGILAGEWNSTGGYIFLLFVIIFILLLIVFKLQGRTTELDKGMEETEEPKYLDEDRTEVDILNRFQMFAGSNMFREAILSVYQFFIRSLNVKKSYTPREICRMYGNIPGIKTITEIFERIYYGDIPPTKKDVEEYERFLREKEGN